jgi:hypothetical protein
MRRAVLAAVAVFLLTAFAVRAYVEAPYSLGQICHEATHIVLVEVTRVNAEKNLVIYKKVKDLKGKHPTEEIKHNIGTRGFHPREWQHIKSWAAVGKKAVFFHNGGASETCIGGYWYQCYPEGEWWGMSHAEPFLMRTYHGEADKLADAVERILKGEEVVITCMVDANKEQLHERKGKLQRLKASLKRLNYDAKRDFVGFGGDDDTEYRTIVLVPESSAGWRFLPAPHVSSKGDAWRQPDFDDSNWRTGKAPIGYGEAEIGRRGGSTVNERGQAFVFRKAFDLPADLLAQKGVTLRLRVASDDSAEVFVNGKILDPDPQPDHEFAYWNRDVELQPPQLAQFKPGRNVIGVVVKNRANSSDLYFDLQFTAEIAIPKKK